MAGIYASVRSTARAAPRRSLLWRVGRYLELGKARLSTLVLLTTAVGYVLSAGDAFDGARCAWTLLGTGFTALGANALNEWLEEARDARMNRTRRRPLPAGDLGRHAALRFAVLCTALGPGVLWTCTHPLAATLAMLTLALYVGVYTPLKLRTPANTLVGAVVGALPPLVGWAAANGRIDVGGWVLGGILFLWQVPHFVALAWLYREDYRRGGFRMLPSVDPSGRLTSFVTVVYILLLLPAALMLTLVGVTGWVYAAGAIAFGLAFLLLGAAPERRCTAEAARRVFLASVIYLPLLLGLMLADRQRGPAVLAADQNRTRVTQTDGAPCVAAAAAAGEAPRAGI